MAPDAGVGFVSVMLGSKIEVAHEVMEPAATFPPEPGCKAVAVAVAVS